MVILLKQTEKAEWVASRPAPCTGTVWLSRPLSFELKLYGTEPSGSESGLKITAHEEDGKKYMTVAREGHGELSNTQ